MKPTQYSRVRRETYSKGKKTQDTDVSNCQMPSHLRSEISATTRTHKKSRGTRATPQRAARVPRHSYKVSESSSWNLLTRRHKKSRGTDRESDRASLSVRPTARCLLFFALFPTSSDDLSNWQDKSSSQKGLSLNRSQCGGCSTKYDTPAGT